MRTLTTIAPASVVKAIKDEAKYRKVYDFANAVQIYSDGRYMKVKTFDAGPLPEWLKELVRGLDQSSHEIYAMTVQGSFGHPEDWKTNCLNSVRIRVRE